MNFLKDFFLIANNIDQEAVLRFFNCEDPNVFDNGDFNGVGAIKVSLEVLKRS